MEFWFGFGFGFWSGLGGQTSLCSSHRSSRLCPLGSVLSALSSRLCLLGSVLLDSAVFFLTKTDWRRQSREEQSLEDREQSRQKPSRAEREEPRRLSTEPRGQSREDRAEKTEPRRQSREEQSREEQSPRRQTKDRKNVQEPVLGFGLYIYALPSRNCDSRTKGRRLDSGLDPAFERLRTIR